MRVIGIVILVTGLVAATALTKCDDDSVTKCGVIDAAAGLPKHTVELLEMSYGSLDSVPACEIGPYIVYFYGEGEQTGSSLVVYKSPEDLVWIKSNGGISVSLEEGRLFLDVDDKDNDGSLDWLAYEVYSKDSDGSVSIIDNDLDGQAESRSEKVAGEKLRLSLWFNGTWRPIQWLNGPEPNRILVDGVWSRYEAIEGEIVLVNDDD